MIRQLSVLLFASVACAVHINERDVDAARPQQGAQTEMFSYKQVLKRLNGMEAEGATAEGGVDTGVYEWTQAGIDTVAAANKMEEFSRPQVGQKLTASQTIFASGMGLKVKQMREEHLVSGVGTHSRSLVNTEALLAQQKRLKEAQQRDETLLQWTQKGASMLKSYGYFEVFGSPKESEVVNNRQLRLVTSGSEFNMTQLLDNGMVAHIDANGDAVHNGGVVDTKKHYKFTAQGIQMLHSGGSGTGTIIGSVLDALGDPKEGESVTELMIKKADVRGLPIEKLITDKIIAEDVVPGMHGPEGNINVLLDSSNAGTLYWTQAGVDMAKKNGLYDQLGHPGANQAVVKEQKEQIDLAASKQGHTIEDLVAQGLLAK